MVFVSSVSTIRDFGTDMNCETCKRIFTPMPAFEDFNQADGCAATLYLRDGQYYILAHYGSRFDMQRYALKTGGSYDVGHICDDCINRYINEGKASLIEDGVW